jgi:acyl dehydratase
MTVGLQACRERAFVQADFDRFAELSGDHNPIHVDPEFAAHSRFRRTVAHGVLLMTVLRGLVGQLAPGARMSAQTVMFPAPTFADESMAFCAEITGRSGPETHFSLEVRRVADGVVTCQGSCTVQP